MLSHGWRHFCATIYEVLPVFFDRKSMPLSAIKFLVFFTENSISLSVDGGPVTGFITLGAKCHWIEFTKKVERAFEILTTFSARQLVSNCFQYREMFSRNLLGKKRHQMKKSKWMLMINSKQFSKWESLTQIWEEPTIFHNLLSVRTW